MSSDEKYIIIFGETGSGKSTFINYLVNYFAHGSIDKPKIAISNRFHQANMHFDYREKALDDVTKSKTVDCHSYSFELEGVKFTFVDTPGINDTGGLHQDSRNIESIFSYLRQLPEITALVLIMNGAVCRATTNIRHALNAFQERLPDASYNNLLIILTNCQSHSVNFNPHELGLSKKCPVFHMQNSAFSSNPKQWSPHTRDVLGDEFKKSMKTINSIIVTLCKFEAQSTVSFKDMDDNRNALKQELHAVRMMLFDLRSMEDELIGFEISADIHSSNIQRFQNFAQTKQVCRRVPFKTDYHSTTCSHCNNVCHERCFLNENPAIGSETIFCCLVMHKNRCKVCQCEARFHYHGKTIYRNVNTTIHEVVRSLEQNYHDAKMGKEEALVKCNSIHDTKKLLDTELKNQYKKVKKNLEQLRKTCANTNVTSELYDFIVCLREDVSQLKHDSVIKKAQAFITDLEQLCKDLENSKMPSDTENEAQPDVRPPPIPHRQSNTVIKPMTKEKQTTKESKLTAIEAPSPKSDESTLVQQESLKPVLPAVDVQYLQSLVWQSAQSVPEAQSQDDANEDKYCDASETMESVHSPCSPPIAGRTDSSGPKYNQNCEGIITTEDAGETKPITTTTNFAVYTLTELIEASKTHRHKSIRRELDNRSRGKALGLLSNQELFSLCENFAELRGQGLRKLVRIRDELEEQIKLITEDDPFEIEKVKQETLLRLAAINLLMYFSPSETEVTNTQPVNSFVRIIPMAKIISAIKDAVSNSGKHQFSSSSTDGSNVAPVHENLDTRSMAKILIIGETGSGKSTFINYLTNFFRKGTLQCPKVAIPSRYHPHATENFVHHENDIQNTTQSKTDSCNQYMFVHNSKQYLFLDTPGLADTRGAEQDDKNILQIINSVESLGGLATVIIVVNGAVCRLTVNLRNVIARLRGNLPDIVMDNVILVLTNTTRHAANFNIGSFELNGNVYPYYMQNSAFSQDPSTWTTSAREALQNEWDQAMSEIAAMLQTIDTFKTKSVKAFKTMKDIRSEIKTLMHKARLEVSQIQKMQDEIAACETAMQHANDNLVKFKDYKKERVVEKEEIVDAPYHSTLCQKCSHVCHDRCGLHETTTVGAQIFQQCWAINNNSCSQCPNKCSYTSHYHAKKTVKKTKEKLEDVLADIKAKYDTASKDKSSYQQKISTTADAKALLQKALNQKKEDIKQLCTQLHQLCSGFNMAQELHALIDQLEAEAVMLKNIDAKKQAMEFIRSLKEFCSMIEKDQSTMQQRLPKMNIIDTERPIQGQAPRPSTAVPPIEPSQIGASGAPTRSLVSNSHVDDEVLATLRALGKKKTVKGKTKKKGNEKSEASGTENSDDDEESDILTAESSDDEGKSNSEAKKRKKSKKTKQSLTTSTPTPSSVTIDSEQLKELTINELLARYRSCPDQRVQNFYTYELTQRSYGKSAGPMKNAASIAEFTASTQKYCALGLNALKQEYERLKQRIIAITEPDILKIDQVPPNLLIEIAAVHCLMLRSPPEETPLPPAQSYPRPQELMRMTPNYPSADVFMFPEAHPRSFERSTNMPQHLHTDERQQFRFPSPIPSQQYRANVYHHPQAYGHPPPYVTHQQQSFQPIHRPVPIRPYVPSTSMRDAFDRMHIAPEQYDFPYSFSTHSQSSVSTDSGHGTNMHSNSSTPVHFVTKDDSDKDIRQLTNTQLLSKYHDAYNQRNHEKCSTLYSELKRRCYGDHPVLMQEKRELFDKILQVNDGRPLTELKEAYSTISQTIRGYLTDDNCTHLNEIPFYLIVEAGALSHLISTKIV